MRDFLSCFEAIDDQEPEQDAASTRMEHEEVSCETPTWAPPVTADSSSKDGNKNP